MSKKILVLEPSSTIQKLFINSLDDDYSLVFITDTREAITKLLETIPDIFLLNAECSDPGTFEIVRLVRSFACFKELGIGVYAVQPFPFDEELAKMTGVNAFVRLEQKTMAQDIDSLSRISSKPVDRPAVTQLKKTLDDKQLFLVSTNLIQTDNTKTAIMERMSKMLIQLESVPGLVKEFLLLITEFAEVPVASLYVVENDGVHGYYVCAENMEESDITDFLNVCASDFEKVNPDYNAAKVTPVRLETLPSLNRFFSKTVPLSSYETSELKGKGENGNDEHYGTVHIVSEGSLSPAKLSLFRYCVENIGLLFQKALIMEKKIFFEKRIRRAFSRFVPEQIIDDLVAQADKEESVSVGETRAVAILFSDIRSFTSISERNKPDVMVSFLNRYFTAMVNVIKKHGGTIDKFIGDAIMALFGAPVSYEDNSRRAVAAAYEMREILPTVEMGDLILPEGMTFNIGIGIHYGDVTVGSLGSEDKTDYTVIGDSVNLASRLEGLTKTYGTQVLVSESVRLDAGAETSGFCFRHLDDVKVKGKAKAVPIYAVDRNSYEFSAAYKDAYHKGMDLYTQGIWNLAKEYFAKALAESKDDKAAKLMLSRCEEFIKNPPENWDGAIAFTTK